MLDEVIDQLTEDEIVTVEELSLEAGTEIDLSKDFSGIQYNTEKVKLTFEKAETQEGKAFDYQKPGNYYAKYYAEPVSGNPLYQVIRKVIVRERSRKLPQKMVPVARIHLMIKAPMTRRVIRRKNRRLT